MSFNHKTAISWCSTMNRFLSVITGKVMVLHRRKNGECGSGPVAVGQWAAERDRFNVHPVGGRVQDRDCGMLIGGEYNESSKVPIVLMASNEVLGDGDDGDSESLRISLVDSSVVSDDESFDQVPAMGTEGSECIVDPALDQTIRCRSGPFGTESE